MLLKDFLRSGSERLESLYPDPEARNIILMLCEERLGTKSYTHLVEPEYSIKEKDLRQLKEDLARLSVGEPVQYVLGYADFCGLRFKVTPDVLIPRPETELMCREAVKEGERLRRMRQAYGNNYPVKILDLCTGSGCIAWTLALNVSGSVVIGTDISEKALLVALNQDFSSKLKETGARAPEFMIADVLGDESAIDETGFDIILSNPPYILESQKDQLRPNVLDHEPPTALFVPDGDQLLFHKAIARWSASLLSPEGWGMTEINELLGDETSMVFSEAGFSHVEVVKDYFDKDRFIHYRR
jgi:release factor glutamine methyltransferase